MVHVTTFLTNQPLQEAMVQGICKRQWYRRQHFWWISLCRRQWYSKFAVGNGTGGNIFDESASAGGNGTGHLQEAMVQESICRRQWYRRRHNGGGFSLQRNSSQIALNVAHCTLYRAYCTLQMTRRMLHTAHWLSHIAHCTSCCTLHIVLHIAHCAAHCILNAAHCAMHIAHYTSHITPCTLHTAHCILCRLKTLHMHQCFGCILSDKKAKIFFLNLWCTFVSWY